MRRLLTGCWALALLLSLAAPARADVLGKFLKHLPVGFLGPEVVQVIRLDVGHHGHFRRVGQERTIGFVGFGHEDVPGALVGIGAGPVELATDGEGRIFARGLQRGHGHGRGGSLAVRARQ